MLKLCLDTGTPGIFGRPTCLPDIVRIAQRSLYACRRIAMIILDAQGPKTRRGTTSCLRGCENERIGIAILHRTKGPVWR